MKTTSPTFLAFDLGAESGRAIIGRLENNRLNLEVLHRFPNQPVQVGRSLHWDILSLWREIQISLTMAVDKCGESLASLGMDTWGVDFGLLARDDSLLCNPYHYRDHRTDNIFDVAFQSISREEIYELTGIQFMQLNSLYQLLAMERENSSILETAKTFLNIPDLLNFWLTGRKTSEFTIATTTQCYNPRRAEWAWGLLDQFNIPTDIFQDIVTPGTILDSLLPSVAEEVRCPIIPVVAVASHDTNSAVAAIPSQEEECVYLSSGTWSLLGVEVDHPIISPQSLSWDFTNEGGVNNKFCLLKSIVGLWLVQESQRHWENNGKKYSYDDLTQLADQSLAFRSLIIPDNPRFFSTGNMPGRIQTFCHDTDQIVPQSEGEIIRCALESLALEYRWVIEHLETLVGHHLPVIHIVGGGSRNWLLNQLTADATGRPVIAGPVEASAIGNILVQAQALGYLSSLSEGRQLVNTSFEVRTFLPRETESWEVSYERFKEIRIQTGQGVSS